MKKVILLTVFTSFTFFLSAQLIVNSNGNTAVKTSSTPLSALSIGGAGNSSYKVYVEDVNVGIYSLRTGTPTDSWIYGARCMNSNTSSNFNIGLNGQAYTSTALSGGRSFGVLGLAGNCSSGYNYGVYGALYGTQQGAAIVGAVNTLSVNASGGQYAGWFQGDVIVTGLINGVTVGNSDLRYKKDIVELEDNAILDKLLKLKPIEYYLRKMPTDAAVDTGEVNSYYDEKSQVFTKKKFGLIAQDLQKIYPNLVYENEDGYFSVDYIGLVPLLIQSIKELHVELEELKTDVLLRNALFIDGQEVGTSNSLEIAILYQNTPNPFNQTTEIKYYLPASIIKASLCIYDLQGNQLKQIELAVRGNGSVTISASEFNAGMYLYALLADGKEMGVKRMILTK